MRSERFVSDLDFDRIFDPVVVMKLKLGSGETGSFLSTDRSSLKIAIDELR